MSVLRFGFEVSGVLREESSTILAGVSGSEYEGCSVYKALDTVRRLDTGG